MSALGQATLGVQCQDKALGMATLGVFCPAAEEEQVHPGAVWWNYREQAIREDEEILLLCRAFLTLIQ